MFLNLIAPINNLGYGITGWNILKHLMKAGHSVSLFPIGNNAEVERTDENVELLKTAVNNSEWFNPNAPCIRLWHQHDMNLFAGSPRIGFPIFELDAFSEKEIHHLSGLDRIFVCSKWAAEVVKKHVPNKQVDVVPLGVDSSMFYVDEAARRRRPYWTKDTTVFINVGKWEVRKGHNELLEAFTRAFSESDDVELWMMNDNPFIKMENEQWKAKYISSPLGKKVRILPRVASQNQMREIFNQVDFGVFPSHAEGWNLEPLELMACGVPSIITDYSGHTEYATNANSILLPTDGMTKAIDGRWFHGQGNWATYSVNELAELMLSAHKNKKLLHGQAMKKSMEETVKAFSWNNSVGAIERALGV